MTVEPSYTENELRRVGAEYNLSGYLDRVIRRSTPDSRLQAIADAWNESTELRYTERDYLRKEWPELTNAIEDALTEEKS